MKEVAEHLRAHAIANYADAVAELFIKSACNRYYYHVYLMLRQEAYSLLDASKKFEHGSKSSNAIHESYKKKIMDKLKSMGLATESEIVEELARDLIKKFTWLYDIREEADYNSPKVTMTPGDARINFTKKSKTHEYSISEIEFQASETESIIQQLSTYRQMAGY
jgi:hypothetical protein